MSFITSSAIVLGKWTNVNPDPVSLSNSNLNIAVIQYTPVGNHIMTMPFYSQSYAQGIYTQQYNYQFLNYRQGSYYFGRDFLLGTIDNNYPGNAFLTQFLADP